MVNSCENWMEELWDVIGNRPLRDIVLPACHDAGVYKLTHTFGVLGLGADDCNTRAQAVEIKDQLKKGARCFDLRLALWGENNTWYFHHGTIKDIKGVKMYFGAFGEELKKALEGIRDFAKKNRKELIILWFSHYLFMPTIVQGEIRDCNYKEKIEVLKIIKEELKEVIHKSSDFRKSLPDCTPEELVSGGNVICVFDDLNAMADPEDGIFSSGGNLNTKYTPGMTVSKDGQDWQVNCAFVFMDDDTNGLKFVASRNGSGDLSRLTSLHGQQSKRGPALAVGSDGTLYAVFVANDDSNRLLLSKSTDNGKTWSADILLNIQSPYSRCDSDPSIVVRKDGRRETLYVLYLSGKEVVVVWSLDGGASWSAAMQVHQASNKAPSLAIDSEGTLHAVFVALNDKDLLWTKLPKGATKWSEQVKLEQATKAAPSVVADSDGTLYTLFVSNDNNNSLLLTTLKKGESKWSKEREVGGNTKMSPMLAIDADNTLYALYVAKNETNSLLLTKSTDRGASWGGSVTLSAPSNLTTVSDSADSHEVRKVMTFEKGRLCCYRPRPGVLYGMSWMGTWHPQPAIVADPCPCLDKMAQELRASLLPSMKEWVKEGIITSTRRPNLLGVDWYDSDILETIEYLNKVLR